MFSDVRPDQDVRNLLSPMTLETRVDIIIQNNVSTVPMVLPMATTPLSPRLRHSQQHHSAQGGPTDQFQRQETVDKPPRVAGCDRT